MSSLKLSSLRLESSFQGKIHYYAREKYYQAMQEAALEGCKKLTGDPVYRFYSAISLLFQGQLQGAIRQLEPLKVANLNFIFNFVYNFNIIDTQT